ncbi:hypothetical protein ACVIF9_010405 [Bradyrhizobium sp. USDA 4350]
MTRPTTPTRLTTRSQVVETESVSESVIDGHQKEQSASNQQNG